MNASRVFTLEQVQVECMEVPTCEYDYILTGRKEVGLSTASKQKEFLGLQKRGSKKFVSCGPLLKKEGVIKIPPAANYLDGDTVTFSCKPKYFLHGDPVRTCHNGTWSPGWWVWCRDRNLEYALKWMTALLSIFGIVLVFVIFFCILWSIRRRKEADAIEAGKVRKYRNRNNPSQPTTRTISRTTSTTRGGVKRDAQTPSFSTGNGAAAVASRRISYTNNELPNQEFRVC
uniref:Sushi domain-containing protein n=1 Tax=Panagrolaimus superbus TaxID=310955 RepID=A0A914YBG9_9BILA